MVLPAPQDGRFFTHAEIAGMFGRKRTVVQGWVSYGVRAVTGQRVRLRTLTVPRGRVTASDLAAFLGTVNGVEVRFERQ